MSQKVIENEIANHSTWKLINLYRNYGKSVALQSGIDIASNELIATLDGDLQDPPELITELIKEITMNKISISIPGSNGKMGKTLLNLIFISSTPNVKNKEKYINPFGISI